MLCSAVPTLPESRRMFICDQIAFQFTGKSCECDQNSVGRTSTENCHPPNSTELCSDRGECVCGQCKCDDQHLGVLCECRVDACPRSSDGQVGSGLAILVDQNCPILTRWPRVQGFLTVWALWAEHCRENRGLPHWSPFKKLVVLQLSLDSFVAIRLLWKKLLYYWRTL